MSETVSTATDDVGRLLSAFADAADAAGGNTASTRGPGGCGCGLPVAGAPPTAITQALALLDATVGSSGRPNGQPPAGWLVEQAVLLGGRLAGNVSPARVWLRVDAVQVPRASVPALLGAVDTAWSAPPRTVVVRAEEASR